MPVPSAEPSWWGSVAWLAVLGAIASAVAWLSGTRLHVRKGPYVALLLAVTAASTAGYVAWLGLGVRDVLTTHWGWGIVAGVVAGLVLVRPVTRQPVDRPLGRGQRAAVLAWEGVVYGVAEGVLLSALPPFMAWQAVRSLGWTGTAGGVARWVLPILAGAVVVVVHHLGYWSVRNRILIPITVGLAVLTVAFLVTASWVAPAVAHIIVHVTCILHGSEMPPRDRPLAVPAGELGLTQAA